MSHAHDLSAALPADRSFDRARRARRASPSSHLRRRVSGVRRAPDRRLGRRVQRHRPGLHAPGVVARRRRAARRASPTTRSSASCSASPACATTRSSTGRTCSASAPTRASMGIGRRLKEYQRATLAARGINREFWTFDPLQAQNAHLNINRLGVRVIDYVVDMYGSMGSPLHFGVATDRLIVECTTGARARSTPAPATPALEHLGALANSQPRAAHRRRGVPGRVAHRRAARDSHRRRSGEPGRTGRLESLAPRDADAFPVGVPPRLSRHRAPSRSHRIARVLCAPARPRPTASERRR